MQEFIDTLTRYRQAKALLKNQTVEELELITTNLSKILDEKKEQEATLLEEQQEKNEKLAAYKEMLAADGIDINELAAHVTNTPKQQKSPRTPRPAKYAYTDEDGQSKTWTGQGRTPKFLVDKNLEDYLI
ncbi:H-NS family nucleoid-associated regulatory protein [Photobacterium toruni]|uniref:DNA-binding protein n=1 Tax=Photobacterium toruni TaxID=1935446 RepID=A0ABU6LAK5_9GAMM|nr:MULTISPECIES: H-NS family nucleoid-associated regulatory protein [Photobacterium]MEC6833584.1 H-NS family nucleoid-associated regulatory protein [Photobacterium toruni]MEC6909640.1 H-NS family nucleoid-associated regulatory protein [Photobacterium piscicola]